MESSKILDAASILSRVGRGGDVVLFAAAALILRDCCLSRLLSRGRVVWDRRRLGVGACGVVALMWSGILKFPALATIICVPPVTHVAFATALFEPFSGGLTYATLQGTGWTLYAALIVDATLLATGALPADSRIASTFGLSEARTLGALGAAAHLSLLSSLAVRAERPKPSSLADECACVALLIAGAAAVGVALCVHVDPDETASVFAAVLGVRAVPNAIPQAVALGAAVLPPCVLAVDLLNSRFGGPCRLAALGAWLGGLALSSQQRRTGAIALVATSLLLAVTSRLHPRSPSRDRLFRRQHRDDLCLLIALCAAASSSSAQRDTTMDANNRPWQPDHAGALAPRHGWPPHLTCAIATFLFDDAAATTPNQRKRHPGDYSYGRRRQRPHILPRRPPRRSAFLHDPLVDLDT